MRSAVPMKITAIQRAMDNKTYNTPSKNPPHRPTTAVMSTTKTTTSRNTPIWPA